MADDSYFSNPFDFLRGVKTESCDDTSLAADSLLFAKAFEDLAATPSEILLAQKEDWKMSRKRDRQKKTVQSSFGGEIAIALHSAKNRKGKPADIASESPSVVEKKLLPSPPVQKAKKKARREPGGDDDLAFFQYAMEGISPLKGKERVFREKEASPVVIPKESLSELLERSFEFQLVSRDEYVEGFIAGLDVATLEKLKNGGFSPEAHLDLHGFTVSGACEALRDFMRDAWYKGLRTVLLIPGRGLNSVGGYAILRAKLTQWLTQEPFRRVVLAFCTALPTDGGPGSIYVLLRRYKKKGHICWERTPLDSELF